MLNKLFDSSEKVISAAGKGPLAFATLVVLVLSGLGSAFFGGEPVEVRIVMFLVLFFLFASMAGFVLWAKFSRSRSVDHDDVEWEDWEGWDNRLDWGKAPKTLAKDNVDKNNVNGTKKQKKNILYCSFCGKSQHEVQKLIAGPTVLICDECNDLWLFIIDDKDSDHKAKAVSELCELSIQAQNVDISEHDRIAFRDKIQHLAQAIRKRRRERAGDVVLDCLLRGVTGAGNFATVWEAVRLPADYIREETGHKRLTMLNGEFKKIPDRADLEKVAIKIFDQDKFGMGLMVWRFQRGIRAMKHLTAMANLAPKSVVELYDVSNDGLSFSMQFLPGGDLENIKHFGWSIEKKLTIFHQISKAVEFAHSQGIVYQDIKPANILLDTYHWPILTDFDIADLKFAATQSMAAASLGTPQFAAPEQLVHDTLIGEPSADIYSLGKLLYFLVMEEPPALGSTESNHVPQYLAQLDDKTIRQVIFKCINYNPKERFGSVQQLLQSLKVDIGAIRSEL